ncbi:MAG TPA: glycosyltransferase family 4 protein [Baekduia sp.]|uniref:glycosyltransferase family 4 protein n=1 Tax=Baekduia sp. TaxID=2600305 RepID=UPI002BEB56B9|nr:glycosyltransferase family 4 protein [Baekduia sp.]HMJ33997.1 glycosyltransferase family 4 protein [Baekduia sp.]
MTASTTVGIVFPGDSDARGTWSGTPAGIASGLAELGLEVRRIDARLPRAVDAVTFNAVALARTRPHESGARRAIRHGRTVARISPTVAVVRGSALAGRLRRAGPVDAIVQIGTGYSVPAGPPVVTFEDLTIPQAVELDYPGWESLSRRAIVARMARQRRAYERATACCLSTSWAADSVVRDYGIARHKVHSVGLGRNYDPVPAPRGWNIPRLLFVGLDWEGKNGPGVLRAFARLRDEHPGARLEVVGGHPSLDAPGVTGHGVLRMDRPDHTAQLERLFQTCTCFVMPSHREASAIAYIEAMTAGLPVIGSAAGGSADLIGDGGQVVDPTDDEALLAAMRRYADAETAMRVGAAARDRSALFTWRAVAERLLRALELPEFDADGLAPFLQPAGVH